MVFVFSDKWHSKTPSRTGLYFQLFRHERSLSVSEETIKAAAFRQEIYKSPVSYRILSNIKTTQFFDLMSRGELPIDTFTEFLAQEAILLARAAELCRKGAERMKVGVGQDQNEKFATFFWERHHDFFKQLEELKSSKKVNPEQQEANDALRMYLNSLESVIAEDKDAKFLLVALLQRDFMHTNVLKTRPWFKIPKSHVCWLDYRKTYNYNDFENVYVLTPTEIFFDKNYEKEDQKEYLAIFQHNLLEALNFIRALLNEPPLKMKDI